MRDRNTWVELSRAMETQDNLLADLEEMAVDNPSPKTLGDRVICRISELKRSTNLIRDEMRKIEDGEE